MQEHITEKLSAYLNQELPKDERQMIAEHLLQCEKCRIQHDEIKLGAALASQLKSADAPQYLWSEIENALDSNRQPKDSLTPVFPFFNLRGLMAAAAVLLAVFGLVAAIYFGLSKNETGVVVQNEPSNIQDTNAAITQTLPTPDAVSANQNTNIAVSSNTNSNASVEPQNDNLQIPPAPKVNPVQRENKPRETVTRAQNDLPVWNVETIAGQPVAGNETIGEKGKLAVGEFLTTDANSRARVQVADIGEVVIAPNSRVQLVSTTAKEHRLSLEKGILQAKILAPPRLFIVDTPSAVAVDLGCEYTLEVDTAGNSKLHVTSGFVALERDGRESIVPAGAICYTRRGLGLGTPFSEEASEEFQNALMRFDFQNGGSGALQTIVAESKFYDSVTLWHLLARVSKNERGKVFDALAAQVSPPASVTREGVLQADKKMLAQWWAKIESIWFE